MNVLARSRRGAFIDRSGWPFHIEAFGQLHIAGTVWPNVYMQQSDCAAGRRGQ